MRMTFQIGDLGDNDRNVKIEEAKANPKWLILSVGNTRRTSTMEVYMNRAEALTLGSALRAMAENLPD